MLTLEEIVAITILVIVFAGGGAVWFVFVRSQDAADRRRQSGQASAEPRSRSTSASTDAGTDDAGANDAASKNAGADDSESA